MMKLAEETSGIGELVSGGVVLPQTRYQISRFQGMAESGLPIPGLYRIEGSIEFNTDRDALEWVGIPLSLRLQDGRVFGVTLVNAEGRILSEGHGPSKCQCC